MTIIGGTKPPHQLIIVVSGHDGYPDMAFSNTKRNMDQAEKSVRTWNAHFPDKPRRIRIYQMVSERELAGEFKLVEHPPVSINISPEVAAVLEIEAQRRRK